MFPTISRHKPTGNIWEEKFHFYHHFSCLPNDVSHDESWWFRLPLVSSSLHSHMFVGGVQITSPGQRQCVLSDDSFRQNLGVSKNWGYRTPKWMGENHGNPMATWMIWREFSHYFLETPQNVLPKILPHR